MRGRTLEKGKGEAMYRVFIFWLVLSSTACGSVIDSSLWINELHYDNSGADENEFVEIVAPSSLSEVGDVTLTLYNGSSGAAYGGPTALSDFTVGDQIDGWVFYSLEMALQNGAPDGLAFARGDQVLQFLSYEGAFAATEGVALGLTSTDIGVLEEPDTLLGTSLQLGGRGDSYLDFHWQSSAPHTLGSVNQGQSLAVPEPTSILLWLCLGGAVMVWHSRWYGRRAGLKQRVR